MFRGSVSKGMDHDPDFEWRGDNVTRIENLSDIAFALALGMLVSGSGTPETFVDLKKFLYSFIPVAAAFSVLFGIWQQHFTFFRRYGLNDKKIITYNAILIFVILYMAYPLRFAFDSLFAFILMQFGNMDMMISLGINTFAASGIIIGYFAVSYAATYILLALMYRHAFKKREEIGLNAVEINETRCEIFVLVYLGLQALIVAALAYFTKLTGFAAMIFFFSFVAHILAKRIYPTPKPTK